MKELRLLDKAIAFAAVSHEGTFDKGGKPYFLHLMAVMQGLKEKDEELQCIAVLHDIVEDTDVTHDEILAAFGYRVHTGVKLLTKQRGIPYKQYLADIATNRDAILVKMSDLRHNADLRRLKGVTKKDLDRHIKYMEAYDWLKDQLKQMPRD